MLHNLERWLFDIQFINYLQSDCGRGSSRRYKLVENTFFAFKEFMILLWKRGVLGSLIVYLKKEAICAIGWVWVSMREVAES